MKRVAVGFDGVGWQAVVLFGVAVATAGCSGDVLPRETTSARAEAAVTGLEWGVNGHPQQQEYRNWDSAEVTEQIGYIEDLGVTHYRVSSEQYQDCPSCLFDAFYAADPDFESHFTLLPVLSLDLTLDKNQYPNLFQANYDAMYQRAQTWATYAIERNYDIPYWELGNEPENDSTLDFSMTGDGSLESDWPDSDSIDALAGGLHGLYWGIHDAYAGRDVSCIGGGAWVHWGLFEKIRDRIGTLPFDALSWHWYEPKFGAFGSPNNYDNGESAADSLAAFQKDVWITETNREGQEEINQTWAPLGGSCASYEGPTQDEGDQATALAASIEDLGARKSDGSRVVTAIFAYELYDEPITRANDLCAEGSYGLMTTATDGSYSHAQKQAYSTFKAKVAGL